MSPQRARMMEDMRVQGMGDKAQKSDIRSTKDFAKFLGRAPDPATPEELRAYQLHITDTGVTPSTYNTRIVALKFFFGIYNAGARTWSLQALTADRPRPILRRALAEPEHQCRAERRAR